MASPSEPTYARATISLPGYPHGTLVPIDLDAPTPYVAACLAEGYLEVVLDAAEAAPTGTPTIVSVDGVA